MAFTFCGSQGSHQLLNSIESIQVNSEAEWRALPFDVKIANTFDIAAVSFKAKIVVFGGSSLNLKNLYIFSEEGELESDFSDSPQTPGSMGWGTYAVVREKLYAAGID